MDKRHDFVPGKKLFGETLCALSGCLRPIFHDVHHVEPTDSGKLVNETPSGEAGADADGVVGLAAARDPFHENVEKLSPDPEFSVNDCIESLLRQLADLSGVRDQWQRRARAFQEGYRDKSFEVTALEIQLMDLRAHGVDKITARNNQSLRVKLHATSIERNELKAERDALLQTLETRAEREMEMIAGICEENDKFREALLATRQTLAEYDDDEALKIQARAIDAALVHDQKEGK